MKGESIKRALKSFGLTEKESEIYIFLAKYGTITGGQISKQTKTHRPQMYRILKSLIEKGVVESTLEAPTRFNALPFQQVLEKYIQQHIEASTDQDIFFSWHGGEPTLIGLNYFQNIIMLQRKHKPSNRRIVNGIQTNGTLLNDEWCSFLSAENFLVGLSLDGPKKLHDHFRKTKDQKSTFDKTMQGLSLLKKFNIQFEILCVVNSPI